MPTVLNITATAKSSMTVTLSNFLDAAGNTATITAATYTLTDTAGNVINGKEDETLTPGGTITMLLSGNDLARQPGESGNTVTRRVLLEMTYSSDLGTGLPLNWELEFDIAIPAAEV